MGILMLERSVRAISAAVVPLALAAAASPVPLLVLLVLLVTPRAVPNGAAFSVGWAGALLGVGAVTLAAVGAGMDLRDDGTVVAGLTALVGVLMLVLAGWQWSRRPRDASAMPVPRWLTAADDCTLTHAFGLGVIMVLLNPKVLALTVGAVSTIATLGTGPARALDLLLFAALGSLGALIPFGFRVVLGMRATGGLQSCRAWLVAHGAGVASAVLGAVGLLLVVRGALAL